MVKKFFLLFLFMKEPGFDVNDFYTPLSEAKEEIWRRWNDKDLRKRVRKYLRDNIPEVFRSGPKAVFARHVATPNYESFRFLDLAEKSGLGHIFMEYLNDLFRAKNPTKYYLGKLVFFGGIGKKGGERRTVNRIVDFDKAEGERICDVATLSGVNLVDFHHRFCQAHGVDLNGNIFDISAWYNNNGRVAHEYYKYYFALFICHGVSFESYSMKDKYEREFIRGIAAPCFRNMWDHFGVKPLIVNLHSGTDDDVTHEYFYDRAFDDSDDEVGIQPSATVKNKI